MIVRIMPLAVVIYLCVFAAPWNPTICDAENMPCQVRRQVAEFLAYVDRNGDQVSEPMRSALHAVVAAVWAWNGDDVNSVKSLSAISLPSIRSHAELAIARGLVFSGRHQHSDALLGPYRQDQYWSFRVERALQQCNWTEALHSVSHIQDSELRMQSLALVVKGALTLSKKLASPDKDILRALSNGLSWSPRPSDDTSPLSLSDVDLAHIYTMALLQDWEPCINLLHLQDPSPDRDDCLIGIGRFAIIHVPEREWRTIDETIRDDRGRAVLRGAVVEALNELGRFDEATSLFPLLDDWGRARVATRLAKIGHTGPALNVAREIRDCSTYGIVLHEISGCLGGRPWAMTKDDIVKLDDRCRQELEKEARAVAYARVASLYMRLGDHRNAQSRFGAALAEADQLPIERGLGEDRTNAYCGIGVIQHEMGLEGESVSTFRGAFKAMQGEHRGPYRLALQAKVVNNMISVGEGQEALRIIEDTADMGSQARFVEPILRRLAKDGLELQQLRHLISEQGNVEARLLAAVGAAKGLIERQRGPIDWRDDFIRYAVEGVTE